jgi:hypothetical protein
MLCLDGGSYAVWDCKGRARHGRGRGVYPAAVAGTLRIDARKLAAGVSPTADFELISDGKVATVAELKTFQSGDAAEVELDCQEDELIAGVLGTDNGTERVGNAINKAARQLPGYECPKVLVLLNFDECMDESDLVAAYRGELNYLGSDGHRTIDRSAARVAEGRIREKKRLIDVFLWVDGRSGKVTAAKVQWKGVRRRCSRNQATPPTGGTTKSAQNDGCRDGGTTGGGVQRVAGAHARGAFAPSGAP